MTEKEEILAILKTIQTEHKDPSNLLLKLRDDVQKTKLFKFDAFEKRLHDLILLYLKDNNPIIKISVLNLLHQCILKDLFKDESNIDLLIFVLDILQQDIQNVEEQAQWLKAFDIVLLSEKLLAEILEYKLPQVINTFHIALKSKTANGQQKRKALLLLSSIFERANQKTIISFAGEIFEELMRLMFSAGNPALQNTAVDLANQMLPSLTLTLHMHWDKIVAVFKEAYIAPMTNFVAEGNVVFSKLWIFLTKLFGTRLHKAALMMNPMLTIVETAFKSHNFSVRKEAFQCWQALIENYALDPKELWSPKRIKLLTIPLKTNNCKTEELILAKFQTWKQLINYLSAKIEQFSKGVLDMFLNFCFGQLCDVPLASIGTPVLASPGKKYPVLYHSSCKAFVQLIGQPQYIDEQLRQALDIFSFRLPIVTKKVFLDLPKVYIFATGECSFLLSELEQNALTAQMNLVAWKSMFCIVDSCDAAERKRIIDDVVNIIIALFTYIKRRPTLFSFSIKTVLDIINTREFAFFQEKQMLQLLFLPLLAWPLKKDWDLFTNEYNDLATSTCLFYRGTADNFEALQSIISKFYKNSQTELTNNRLSLLLPFWLTLAQELRIELEKEKDEPVDEEVFVTCVSDFLKWPLYIYVSDISTEHKQILQNVTEAWKKLYLTFSSHASLIVQTRVQIALLLLICTSLDEQPQTEPLGECFYTIVFNISCQPYSKENDENMCNLFSIIRDTVALSTVSKITMHLFYVCIEHLFEVCADSQYLPAVSLQLVDCLEAIMTNHGRIEILKQVEAFVKKVENSAQLMPMYVKLQEIMKKIKDCATSDQVKAVTQLIAERLKETEGQPPEPTKYEKDLERQQLTLLGYDPDTMTPVKLKGSMLKDAQPEHAMPPPSTPAAPNAPNDNFVVVRTPYKYDPKKFSKTQKEKMSRRREDIPALYQDLSQSQSNTADSNSVPAEAPEENKSPEQSQDNNESQNTNHQSQDSESLEVALGKENERKRKKMSSLEKELLRIKIDTIDGNEYRNRATKRRTRSWYNNHTANNADQNDAKVLRSKNSSEPSQPKVAKTGSATAENKDKLAANEAVENEKTDAKIYEAKTCTVVATQYPFLEIKPGEKIDVIDGSGKIGLVKGPKKISPYRIVDNSNVYSKPISSEICKKISFGTEAEKDDEAKDTNPAETEKATKESSSTGLETANETQGAPEEDSQNTSCTLDDTASMETLSISAEVNENAPAETTVTINSHVCREVVLDTSAEEVICDIRVEEEPPESPTRSSIVSSPVNCETPTRNTELMRNTCDISPIKEAEAQTLPTTSAEQLLSSNLAATDNHEPVINCSPELFNSQEYQGYESAPLQPDSEPTNKAASDPVATNTQVKKNYVGGRGAQMMNMISAKATLVSSPAKKTKSSRKRVEKSTFTSPSQNRTKKMMEKLEANSESKDTEKSNAESVQAIIDEDFLTFSKDLPSALAQPGPSILKRRRDSDSDDGTPTVPAKKRKVNFSDPLVVLQKYIEKNVPVMGSEKGSRILRSTKALTTQREDETQSNDTDESEPVVSTIVEKQETDKVVEEVPSASDPPPSEENNGPACPELVDSTDSVKSIAAHLGRVSLAEPLISVLTSRGIETIGQLAQVTNPQDLKIPFKMSDLQKAFKSFMQRQCNSGGMVVKKIKPITLSTKVQPRAGRKRGAPKAAAGHSRRLKLTNVNHGADQWDANSASETPDAGSKKLGEELGAVAHMEDVASSTIDDVMEYIIFGVKVCNFVNELMKTNYDVSPVIKELFGKITPAMVLRYLSKEEVLKFVAKEYRFVDVVNEFDLEAVYGFLNDLNASAKKTLHLSFFEVMKQLYSVILKNPGKELCVDHLAKVQISHVIVERREEDATTDRFLTKLYGDLYAQRLIQENLRKAASGGHAFDGAEPEPEAEAEPESESSKQVTTPNEIARSLCEQLKDVSEELVVELHRLTSRLLSARKLHQLHYEELLEKL